jgi:hypothetical protein
MVPSFQLDTGSWNLRERCMLSKQPCLKKGCCGFVWPGNFQDGNILPNIKEKAFTVFDEKVLRLLCVRSWGQSALK